MARLAHAAAAFNRFACSWQAPPATPRPRGRRAGAAGRRRRARSATAPRGGSPARSRAARRRAGSPRRTRSATISPGLLRHDLGGHVGRDREIKAVAMGGVVAPFAVGAEVGDRGFDLDDQQRALAVERDDVGAPAVAERRVPYASNSRARARAAARRARSPARFPTAGRRSAHDRSRQRPSRRPESSPPPSRRSSASANWCCRR